VNAGAVATKRIVLQAILHTALKSKRAGNAFADTERGREQRQKIRHRQGTETGTETGTEIEAETRFIYPFVRLPPTYCIGGRYEWVLNSNNSRSLNEVPDCDIM
jgi:hypothetical protein